MREIRVEIKTPSAAEVRSGTGLTLTAKIGDVDVTNWVMSHRAVSLTPYLPADFKHYKNIAWQRSYRLDYLLSHYDPPLLPVGVLTEAIKTLLMHNEATATGEVQTVIAVAGGEDEVSQRLLAAEGGHLLIGGRMFKLSAMVQSDSPTKMLTKVRQNAAAAVRRERDALIAQARTEADIIRRQVLDERDAVARDRAQLNADRASLPLVPQWIINNQYLFRVTTGRIDVLRQITYNPTEFVWPDYSHHGSRVDLKWSPLPASQVVVPIFIAFGRSSGATMIENCHVAPWGSELPHMSYGSACVQPGGVPKTVTSTEQLELVRQAIQRAFQVVNVSSFLRAPDQWSDAVRAFMPTGCVEFYKGQATVEESGAQVVSREAPSTIWGAA